MYVMSGGIVEGTRIETGSMYVFGGSALETPMSIEEAITRMEALGHPFFMYLDEEDDRISTVYIRNDGGYGVIQAENPIK